MHPRAPVPARAAATLVLLLAPPAARAQPAPVSPAPRVSVRTVLAASLVGAVAFFLISNFGVWLGGGMYSPTWKGLLDCYAAGLPFFRNSLLSTFYSPGCSLACTSST